MKSAIIGLGIIGKVHAEVMKELGISLDAVCDVDPHAMEGFSCPKYVDYRVMLEKERPDVVHICTPHYLHYEMTSFCLERGVNVLLEKPVCIKETELDALLLKAERSPAQVGVCFQNRYRGSVSFAKDYLKEHKPVSAYATVLWNRDEAYYASAPWRGKKATEGGGVLINQAIHTTDLLCFLLGKPSEITAVASNLSHPKNDVEDTATILAKGRVPFTLFATVNATSDFENQIVIQTEDSLLRIVGDRIYVNEALQKEAGRVDYYGKSVYGNGHEPLIQDYYEKLEQGEKFPLDLMAAEPAMRVTFKALNSLGKPVKL